MKVHKYWAIGVAIAMTGTFYTGHKYNGKAHKVLGWWHWGAWLWRQAPGIR